ncbi:hypothetical protein JCM9279_003940 [Rhodotorula babjevae]
MSSSKQTAARAASPERAELLEHGAALVKYLGGDQERDWANLVPGADTAWSAAADVHIRSHDGILDSTSPPVAIYNAGFLETGKLYKAILPVLNLPEPAHNTRLWAGTEENEKRWEYIGHANNSSVSQWLINDYRPEMDLKIDFHLRSQEAEYEHIHGVEERVPVYYARTPPAYHPPSLPSRSRSTSPQPDLSSPSSHAMVSDADRHVHMNQVRAFLAWMDVGFKFRGRGWADQRIHIEYRRQGEGKGSSSSTSAHKRDILELVVRLKGIWRLVKLDNPSLAQSGREFYVFGLPGADFAPGDSASSVLSCPLHEYEDPTGHHPFASLDGERLHDEWSFSPSTGRQLDSKRRLVATTWSVKSTCARGTGMSVVFELDNPHEAQPRSVQGVLGRFFRS